MPTTPSTTFPGFTLEAAFGTAATVAASSWTDLSTRLRRGNIDRGRNRETDLFRAGEATFVLNNRDRMLDPEYSAGTWFNQLLPGVQIRLKATYNSITYTLFYGYAESWAQEYPGQDADAICNLTVVDGFSWLALAPLPETVWAATAAYYTGQIAPNSTWYRLGEQYGQVMGDSSGNNFHGAYSAPIVSNKPGLVPFAGTNQSLEFDGIDDVGIAAPEAQFISTGFAIALWASMPNPIPAAGYTTLIRQDNFAISYTIRLNPTGYLTFSVWNSGANDRYSNDPVVAGRTYFIVAQYVGSPGEFWVNGVLQTNSAAGNPNWQSTLKNSTLIGGLNGVGGELAWTSVLDEVMLMNSDLAQADVDALYAAGTAPWNGDTSGGRCTRILDQVGWPATLRDLDAGESILGPTTLGGKTLDYLQVVAQTEAGLFYMTADGKARLVGRGNLLSEAAYTTSAATFGDGGGIEMKYHAITLEPASAQQVKNIGRVSRAGGVVQEYEDTTSSSTYGPREVEQSGLLMASDAEASDRAIGLVLRYKDPGFRVDSLTITPQRDPSNLLPKVLSYELGQKITVARRPQGIGSVISQEVHVEGIAHDFDASSRTFVTTWRTAPTDPNEDNWFIIDSGIFDTSLIGY